MTSESIDPMPLKIKKLFMILFILCFGTGCTQVKQIVTDVKEGIKEGITGKKEEPPKPAPETKEAKPIKEPEAADAGTTKEVKEDTQPPAKAKPKETKAPPSSSKKPPPKTTPPPVGEVFGPK
jgi:hypothetical protein